MPPRRPIGSPEPAEIRVFNTVGELDPAIQKLNRRIDDLLRLKADGTSFDDAEVRTVEHAVSDTVREVFGAGSTQYDRHRYFKVDDGPRSVRTDFGGPSDDDIQRQFHERIPGAIKRIEGLVRYLQERRDELAGPAVAPRAALAGRNLHPSVAAAATALYNNGHYAQAVFEAGKALIDIVKSRSGSPLDGAPLMQNVFSVNKPILAFNGLADQSDRDEQQGLMHLYTGAVLAIRNPGGHRVGAIETPERALQHLELLSYLADRLDEAKRVP